jgi:uroporphyrinogen-III decarboxylase
MEPGLSLPPWDAGYPSNKVIFKPEDIKNLKMPDPYKDGLMPKVLECIDYMKKNSDLPVAFTDCQGPFNIAISLCGPENLFVWMYEYPEAVHEIMDFCTEALIEWIKVQKKHAGQELNSGAFPHMITLPEGFGGVYLCDDDCTVVSPGLYKEFVVPYNSRVLKAFGGGTIHFCGTAIHQLENFLQTDGLTGINNFCMGDFKQIVKMQEMFNDKLALMVCDFTPLKIDSYYTELFSILKRKGTILASFVAPELALNEGKYEVISRKANEMTKTLRDLFVRLK